MPKGCGAVALVGLGVILGLLGVLAALGVSPGDAALLALAVAVQAATGAYWWQRLDPAPMQRSLIERLGLGLALGTVLALLAGVLLFLILPWDWWWITPSLAAMADAAWRRRRPSVEGRPGPVLATLVGIAVSLGALLSSLARYPLVADGPVTTFHPDMLFFEALGTGVARYGSGDSVLMAGEAIRYHWFAYAWAGQLTSSLSVEPFVVLTRVLPIVAILGTLAIAAGWAARITGSRIAPWLAVLLIATGGYVGAVNGTILNFDSPSQSLTTLWLMAFVVVLIGWVAGDAPRRVLVLPVLLAFALVGGKVSAAVVGLGGVLALLAVGVVRRAPWVRRAWLIATVTVAGALLAYVLVIAGNASSGDLLFWDLGRRASTLQGLDSSPLARGVVLGTLALAVAMAFRWAGFVGLVGSRDWRWRPETIAGWGFVLAGLIPLIVFSQGLNETWFALSTSAPLAVLSAAGVVVAWRAASPPRWAAWLAVAAAAVGTLVVAAVWTGRYWEAGLGRFFAPWTGVLVAVVAGVVALLALRERRLRGALAVTIACLVLQGAGARALPDLAQRLGGAPFGIPPSAGSTSTPETSAAHAQHDGPDAAVEPSTAPRVRSAWTPDDRAAAAFLRENAARSDIVVTNETLSYLVPALTGLRTYLSGSTYQGLYGRPDAVRAIPDRMAESMTVTQTGQGDGVSALCDRGVRWAWIARDLVPQTPPTAAWEIAYANPTVLITRLTCR